MPDPNDQTCPVCHGKPAERRVVYFRISKGESMRYWNGNCPMD